jgi:hypothetical protein
MDKRIYYEVSVINNFNALKEPQIVFYYINNKLINIKHFEIAIIFIW